MKRKFQVIGLILTMLFLVGFLGNSLLFAGDKNQETIVITQEEAVIRAVQNVGPAVVSVMVKNDVQTYDLFFRPYNQEVQGLGSGFVFDKRGYILTNYHVVQGAKEIKVIFVDQKEYVAEVVGKDPQNDIAVLKIDAQDENLPVVQLGDSEKIQVGQLTIAIGTPYDINFQNTVTTGVVSALGRSIQGQNRQGVVTTISGVIQTDASINPGNSGGPLLDSQGQAIGINTAILGDAQGMGFAIPINVAKDIVDDLIKYGHVKRPYIGIYGGDISKEALDDYFGFKGEGGVYVHDVVSDSPAAKAGLASGDVILEIDRHKIKNWDDLKKIISEKGIGAQIKVLILRNSGLEVIKLTIAEMPQQD